MDPSSVLPVELLSKIFRHYLTDREDPVQSFDFCNGLWVLVNVNSAWRSMANSSKSLWSTITITKAFMRDTRKDAAPLSDRSLVSRKNANEIRKEILTEILRRSGSCPLIISISFPLSLQRGEVIRSSDYQPLCAILAVHCHRWQSVDIKGPPYLLNHFVHLPSSQLQSLQKLHVIVGDKAVLGQVLHICSGLVELVTGASKGECTLGRIEMPALEHLEIIGDTRALDCISAHHLRSLKIECDPFANMRSDHRGSPVLDFLRHSECSVRAMDVYWCGTHDDLEAILSLTPSLESLKCCIHFNRAFLAKMKSPSSLFPHLHTLTLRFGQTIRFPHVKFILDIVESRLESGFLKRVNIHPVGKTSVQMFDERLAAINAIPDVTVWLEDIYMRHVYSGLVIEDDLP
ncbi:hypothetical protein EDD18DRAFT_797596 [Armillaria luteobubalina]|uniref:F-box domain-containing protein n=1 Tax=Armillaria luteobubalina TaxID=153913 RepID=A0AA39UG96_9AGAR|nr:hypothetical protein EDD18DRAFT_797596 [Armillaria luteobubalina]